MNQMMCRKLYNTCSIFKCIVYHLWCWFQNKLRNIIRLKTEKKLFTAIHHFIIFHSYLHIQIYMIWSRCVNGLWYLCLVRWYPRYEWNSQWQSKLCFVLWNLEQVRYSTTNTMAKYQSEYHVPVCTISRRKTVLKCKTCQILQWVHET